MSGTATAPWRLDAGHCVSPYPGESAAGDAVALHWPRPHVAHALLLDVAGHGPQAARIAAQVCGACATWPDGAAADRLTRCHDLLRNTPGAVGLTIRVDLANQRMQLAAVGNVMWMLCSSGDPRVGAFGQLGAACPPARELELQLRTEETLVAATDGLQSAVWRWLAGPQQFASAGDLAHQAVRRFQRRHDDAACLVLRLQPATPSIGA